MQNIRRRSAPPVSVMCIQEYWQVLMLHRTSIVNFYNSLAVSYKLAMHTTNCWEAVGPHLFKLIPYIWQNS